MPRVLIFKFSIALSGCAGAKKPTQTGFLSDYWKLEEVSDDIRTVAGAGVA